MKQYVYLKLGYEADKLTKEGAIAMLNEQGGFYPGLLSLEEVEGRDKEEQKCKDAGYIEHDINTAKDMEGALKINDMEFKVTVLKMTHYMPPPLKAAKTCFTLHKPGGTFAEVRINSVNVKVEEEKE